jgi:hypothetical protein
MKPLAIVMLGATMAAGGGTPSQTVNFDNFKTGAPPPGWTATKTGTGDAKWTVEKTTPHPASRTC